MLSPHEFLSRLQSGRYKTDAYDDEIKSVLLSLTPDKLSNEQISEWLSNLWVLGPELSPLPFPVMDCCGTGGSGLPHFNTSTIAAFILAAGGVKTVKFGNRGIQQPRGSFDFLAELGFEKPLPLDHVFSSLEKSNLAFVSAPQCFPQLGPIQRVRKQLNQATLFHFIGPLLNPFHPAYRLMGVSHRPMMDKLARALAKDENLSNAWLVQTQLESGDLGLDELAPVGSWAGFNVLPNKVETLTFHTAPINPHFTEGTAVSALNRLLSSLTVEDTVTIFQTAMSSKHSTKNERYNFCYELLLLNAGAGFVVSGVSSTLEDGKQLTLDLLTKGAVKETFQRYRKAYDAATS